MPLTFFVLYVLCNCGNIWILFKKVANIATNDSAMTIANTKRRKDNIIYYI